ncbi:MAG: V-type ATP synthase subunit E [Syntrophales bacterium]|jgi:vacuolar-type H+-ATPase subunit E/Vma4|nr:V-type ATP synthase subunit E [Syntrophales bacterium]
METDDIRNAILKKAKGEADQIIAEAESKIHAMISQAKEQKRQLFEEEKKKKLENAQRESARILAQAALQERQTILREKDSILREILNEVRNKLAASQMDNGNIELLLKETLLAFETKDKIRVLVAPKDLESVQSFIAQDATFKEQIVEVKEKSILGGVMAETLDGMISIDNTFDMRLDMLIPKIMPEIGKTLFGS